MSNPEYRQPDPAAALKGALAAQRKVTEALREEAERVRRDGLDVEGPQSPASTSEGGKP